MSDEPKDITEDEDVVEETPAEEPKAEAEEKPKPKRRRAKKSEEPEASTEETEAPAETDDAEGDDTPDKPQETGAKPKARKGAEVTAGQKRKSRRPKTEETVVVRARARYVRSAPRKARLVVDHIRGKSAEEARAILTHTPRAASEDVLKLLNSALANAESNHELLADELRVKEAFVDEGPTIKRFRPRALGRATRIRKRTCHMTVVLTNEGTE